MMMRVRRKHFPILVRHACLALVTLDCFGFVQGGAAMMSGKISRGDKIVAVDRSP